MDAGVSLGRLYLWSSWHHLHSPGMEDSCQCFHRLVAALVGGTTGVVQSSLPLTAGLSPTLDQGSCCVVHLHPVVPQEGDTPPPCWHPMAAPPLREEVSLPGQSHYPKRQLVSMATWTFCHSWEELVCTHRLGTCPSCSCRLLLDLLLARPSKAQLLPPLLLGRVL